MADSEKDVVITYETLFEMLRLEKSRPELQKLSTTFFGDSLSYINKKLAILNDDAPQTSLFASAEKDKTRRELENIGRILKELYDRREKKILDMAMIKSRTNSQIIDTASMIQSEKELFETITQDLALYRSSNLLKLLGGQEPKSILQQASESGASESVSEILEKPSEASSVAVQTPVETTTTEPQNPNIYKQETSPTKQQSTHMVQTIRFLAAVDEIVGPDLQIYGPFEPQATADLPKELAQALINNNQAQLV